MDTAPAQLLEAQPRGRQSPPEPEGKPVPYGSAVYNEVMHFLIEESYRLDDNRLSAWQELLAPDLLYTMPVRQTLARNDGSGFYPAMNWIYDDYGAIAFKVHRNMELDGAFAEDPPSRTRRLITNMRLFETDSADEYFVQSYVLLRRSRGESPDTQSLSARRDDVLRRVGEGFQLKRRTVWIDQAVLGMSNLAVFL